MRSRKLAVAVILLALPVRAENAERGQVEAEEQVLPKLSLLCGGAFTVRYDLASLKANNQDMGFDQTSGSLECDEPLRFLWTLCQSETGKAAVRRNELREVQCRGVQGHEGRLSVKNGIILVERANEEAEAAQRAKLQFEKALSLKVPMAVADPYADQAWRDFRMAPAPVTSTTDYCLVSGNKEKYDASAVDHLRGDGTVKCLKAGAVVVDLVVKNRKKTGLDRAERDHWYRVEHLVDDRREGLQEEFKQGARVSQSLWKGGERVWSKEFTQTGKLTDFTRQLAKGQASLRLTEDGRVTSLSCLPELRDDEVLAAWCGFGGEKTVQVYDGTGKVNAVRTFRDGRLVREAPGDSPYSTRVAVSFVEGKKDGEERVLREDGTLERTVQWSAGVQNGLEQTYAKDGKKVVQRTTWQAGASVESVENFLNGNPKRREQYEGDKAMQRTTWFDLGQKESEVHLLRCRQAWREGWCEDGLEQRWFENGRLAAQAHWKLGQRDGEGKSWFPDGGQRTEERWLNGSITRRREWDEKGALVADAEFEEDGSRKVKR